MSALGRKQTFTFGNEAHDSAGVNDCDGHSLAVRRAASTIRPTVGTYASSRAGAKGTGVCGQVTVEIGAFSRANPRSETIAATSAASEQRGGLSSTTTNLPVFSTLSRMESTSSGDGVRGSNTSA